MSSEPVTQFCAALESSIAKFQLEPLTQKQLGLLVEHYSTLRKWNTKINLTRIIAPEEAARLHYAESLFGGSFIGEARSLLDIGSGAGFPAIPLAVLRADVQVTALEVNHKKALFLSEVKDALRLENFTIERGRFEEFARTGFDLLTCRALDRAEEILPTIIKSLGAGQKLMLYCSADLAARLSKQFASEIVAEVHQIPLSESRMIALFSRR